MTINNQLEGTTLTMAIEGRIDTQTAPELQKAVDASIGDVKDLILDFSKVLYVSSAGLRVILTAQNAMDQKSGSMVIRNAAKNIVDVFKVTGFDTFLNLE